MIDLSLGHLRIGLPARSTRSATYGPPQGDDDLRRAIAAHEQSPIHEVVVTTGASMAIAAALATLPRPGRVLIPHPHYPGHAGIARFLGFEVESYPVSAESTAILAAVDANTRAIILNRPANPTGELAADRLVSDVAAQAAQVLIIDDQVYGEFTYDIPSPARVRKDNVITVKSFSKTFRLAGERIGYALGAEPIVTRIARAHWSLAMSPPATGQRLAVRALENAPKQVSSLRSALRKRRDLALKLCRRLSLDTIPPMGGVFLWFEIPSIPTGSSEFATLCATDGVLVSPGTAFGVASPLAFRLSFAVRPRELEVGLRSVASTLERVQRSLQLRTSLK